MNRRKVFLTGGSGFVGRTLLRELSRIEGLEVVALDRSGTLAGPPGTPSLRVVRGNLLAPDSYAEALRGCDCVLHLAAATGKASPEAHLRETAVGTEVLLETCRTAGVERFLFVSSIAAAFPDRRGYPYAEAKERAERAVAQSGLRYCILRPTMIFGEGAPVFASLAKLALLPVVVVPGSGKARVQPVSVDDVARSILAVLQTDRFQSETLEVGGPEILSMEALLQRIRKSVKGTAGPAIRVPLPLIQFPLLVAERLGLRAVLPTTAGQLSSFRNDGLATANPLLQELEPDLEPLDRMIAATRPIVADADQIEHECQAFTRHLLGVDADRAVVQTYRAALEALPALGVEGPWERALLTLARRGVTGVRCADAFAALFARASVLRQRLVILLAILETRAPYSDRIDAALGGSRPWVFARLAGRGLRSLLYLVAGALWLVPVRLALGTRGGKTR